MLPYCPKQTSSALELFWRVRTCLLFLCFWCLAQSNNLMQPIQSAAPSMYAICLGSALGLQNTMSRWEAIVMSHINNIEWKYSLQLTFPIDRLWFVLSEFPILQSREPGTEGFSSLPKVTQIVYCRAEINTRAMRILSYSAIPWWYLGRNARIVASPMCHGALQQTRLMRPLSLIFSI